MFNNLSEQFEDCFLPFSEEMFPTSVDRLLKEIASFKDRNPFLTSEMEDRIQSLQMELGFLKMFIWLLPKRSLRKSYIRAAVAIGKRKRISNHTASKLLNEVELCKQKIRVDCLYLFDFISHRNCEFSSFYELLQFIDCTISNLINLVRFKAGAIVPVRKQVKALIKKLKISRDFVNTTKPSLFFNIDIRDWAFKIACLSTLYWVDQMEEAMASQMNALLSELTEMVKSPEVKRLRLLKASKLSPGEVIESVVNLMCPVGFMKVLCVELTFLIAFLIDPPQSEMDANRGNLISTKIKVVASEIPSLIHSLTAGGMNESTVRERNFLLLNFKVKTGKLMAEARMLYILKPHFPITNALGFFDLLLENFGNLMDTLTTKVSNIPFAKGQLETLHKDLGSIGPFLKMEPQLQNQLEELKDLWMRINDAVYQAEYVIDSCQMPTVPLWYNMICLSDLIEEMKFIKSEIQETMHKQTLNTEVHNAKLNSGKIHLYQANTLRPDEVVVGFKVEEETIINRLTRGSMKLQIVSIVGMPGQGKTTLAKKVYNSPTVQFHFHMCGWCFVSQVFEEKMVLFNILKGITTMPDDEFHYMSKEDLSHKLYKCLKGQRYLIIMDDIWDITAWNALRESFPDDNNGSRILFTSQNNFGYNPLLLHPFSDEESLELLQHKLFFKDGWPSNFSDHLQKIIKVCNGLPLAVVVVAGLLNRVSNNLDLWRSTVGNLDPKVASEGCADIIELSYNHLPDVLKPCFLYLGAVEQGKVFKVQKLIQLWIAEGFVRKSLIKSLEDVAMEYLEDLIGRSLLIVYKRSFASGEVKECRIHDLLHEFCMRKAEEERFMHFPKYSWKPINYEQYRLCLHGRVSNSWSWKASPIVRSLVLGHRDEFFAYLESDFFSCLKLVRVLDLENSHFHDYFPKEIVSLIFLRYLAIKCDVKVIPSSIGNLRNLECFHVEIWNDILELPQTIWKMKALRNMAIVGGTAFVLNDCDANVSAYLDNLDSFSSLYLSNVKEAERLLRGFPNVRKLKLVFSESWDCRRNCGQFQALHFLSRLESLNLQFSQRVAHTCAFNFPEALKKLTLSELDCPSNQISTIGKLPNLEVLKLLNNAIAGKRWDVGDEEFLKLKYLKLFNLKISHWESFDSSFPCLERLVVRGCGILVELPSIFVDVITLKLIEIKGCHRDLNNSAKSILYEQRENGNEDLEVLISNELDDGEIKLHMRMALTISSNKSPSFCMKNEKVGSLNVHEGKGLVWKILSW